MAIEFKGSWLLVNGAEASAGQVTNFTAKDKYIRHDSNDINTTGYTQFEDKTSLKMYIAGYSYSTYYITKIKYYTSSPLSSFSINSQCSTNNTSSSGKKRGAVLSTNENLVTSSNYSSFQNRTDIKSFYFSSSKSTITWNETIPAGDFYVYIGPSSTDTSNSSYSTIYAVQASDSVKLTHSGVNAPTYTITYQANGGSGSTSSQSVVQGEVIQLSSNGFTAPSTRLYTVTLNGNGGNNGTPTYSSPANKFYCWIKDSASGTAYYDEGADFKPEADTTFYAQWCTPTIMGTTTRSDGEADGYTVNFNANGGSCSTTSLVAKDKVEYSFNSWNSKSDGTGSTLNSTSTYKIYYTRTLYAKWDSDQIEGSGSVNLPTATNEATSTLTITFDYRGGSGSTSSEKSTKTTTKQFRGWGTSATDNAVLLNPYTPSKDQETLYAVWGTASVSYTSFDLPTPTKTGYKFIGWATSASATTGFTGSYTPTSDSVTTLYAIWEANGNIRIYTNSTDKYKMALVYIYAPSSANDTKPWKLAIPYLYTSGTQPWKIIAG